MALFTDRRKPVDIYAKGTATQRAQEKTSYLATAPMRAAVNVGAGAPARMSWERIVQPAAQAVVAPVRNAMQKQQTALANMRSRITGRAADREADALLYGDGVKQVGDNTGPAQRLLVGTGATTNVGTGAGSSGMMRDGIQSARIDQATQESSARTSVPQSTAADAMAYNAANPGQPTQTVYTNNGDKIVAEQRPVNQMTRMVAGAGNASGNRMPQRAGNLDVTFGQDVDPAARERFLRDPVRPTAQIDRYNAQRAGGGMSQGQVASMNADRILNGGGRGEEDINTFGDILRVKRGMAREKLDIQQQEVANQKNRTANELATATDRNGIDRLRLGAEVANHATTTDLARQRLDVDMANNTTKNEIDRLNVTGENVERNATVAEKQLKIRQQEEVAKLQTAYEAAPDDKAKRDIAQKLEARGALTRDKPTVHFDKQFDSQGNVIGSTPYILENGTLRPALPEGNTQKTTAPQSALDALAKNPAKKQDFLKKFGYLPAGY